MKRIVSFVLLTSFLLSLLTLVSCDFCCHTDDDKVPPVELSGDSDLVRTLVEYLEGLYVDYELCYLCVEDLIRYAKNGRPCLHVATDPSNCYFVCGYYDHDHKKCCDYRDCASKYTWVKYENPDDILENYNDLPITVAFQFNRPLFVTNIMSKEADVPNLEHFQEYTPSFNKGKNTNDAIYFQETFIFVDYYISNKPNIYHETSSPISTTVTQRCIYLDEQYYLKFIAGSSYPDGYSSYSQLIWQFGKYYDDLIKIMNKEIRSETIIDIYGLIEIGDFMDFLKQEEQNE